MSQVTLEVKGMSCQHCVKAVKGALEGVSGVSNAEVDLEKGTAVVSGEEIEVPELVSAVEIEGYSASQLGE